MDEDTALSDMHRKVRERREGRDRNIIIVEPLWVRLSVLNRCEVSSFQRLLDMACGIWNRITCPVYR